MKWPSDKLTRFEFARIIGARTLQISLGAPVLTKTETNNSMEIAKDEFRAKVMPITVKRKTPDGEFQVIDMSKAIDRWIEENAGEV